MRLRHGYYGKVNGFNAYQVDTSDGLDIVERSIDFYSPDGGKIFSRNGELFSCVVIKDGINIEDYEEIDIPERE